MKNSRYYNLVYLVVVIAGVFFISSHYISYQQKNYGAALIEQIKLQENSTYELATTVKRSKLTPELTEFVSDCSPKHRSEFDNSLDKLSTLTPVQIDNMAPLFDACANYFVNVKAALIFQLNAELEELKTLVFLATELDQNNVLNSPLDIWNDYLNLEKQLSSDLKEQLDIQIKIVELLKESKASSNPDVQKLVMAARELSQRASVTTKDRDRVFAQLLK